MAEKDSSDGDEQPLSQESPATTQVHVRREIRYTFSRYSDKHRLRRLQRDWQAFIVGDERRRQIVLPPGAWLNRVTRFLLTKQAHARYVEPIIRDMQLEYCDELAAGQVGHARWIAIRGHLQVLPNWVYAWLAHTVRRMLASI